MWYLPFLKDISSPSHWYHVIWYQPLCFKSVSDAAFLKTVSSLFCHTADTYSALILLPQMVQQFLSEISRDCHFPTMPPRITSSHMHTTMTPSLQLPLSKEQLWNSIECNKHINPCYVKMFLKMCALECEYYKEICFVF